MYISRHAEGALKELSSMFGAVLVTGPRQVGKTTMLKRFADHAAYVTLDDPLLLATAKGQSATFFKDNPPPIFIDEVQYAPELFPHIKIIIDRDKKKGQFFMSGSQQFHLMRDVTESLAGRIGLLTLLGLSLREKGGLDFTEAFIPNNTYFENRRGQETKFSYDDVWYNIHRGSMPELAVNDFDWQMYYGSYVKTYIERDVRQLTQVGDELKFLNFMTLIAGRTGQLLNLASLARDVGVSAPTAERWLSILVTSNIVYLLRPYHNNLGKRTVKTPKLYFLDTGLAAYLTKWNTAEVLKNGAMAGAFFESFVISEIIKSFYNKGVMDLPVYFYRDSNMTEIDLLIEDGGVLHPIEIKKHADPSQKDLASFAVLDKIPGIKRGPGGVVCMYDRLLTLSGEDRVIPINMI
mgnify:FL=1